jgi:anti-sigma factor RsiW
VECRETQELLDAFLDGELDIVRAREMERHLAKCAACSGSYDGLESLRAALRIAPLRHSPPSKLEARVRASLHSEVRPNRWFARAALASAVAAGLLVAAVGLWLRPGSNALAREVATAHIRSLLAEHRIDVRSSDRHTVKPWFTGRLNYAPPVPDLSADGFSMTGGRLDYLDERPVAALVYGQREHVINLFVWPAPESTDTTPELQVKQGYNLIHWNGGGMTWWAVSDLNSDELKVFVEHVRGQK